MVIDFDNLPSRGFDASLAELLGTDRTDREAARRRARRWLLDQAAEDATFDAVLVDLAERRLSVGIETDDAGWWGQLTAVEAGMVGVDLGDRDVVVARSAITGLRIECRYEGPAAIDVEVGPGSLADELCRQVLSRPMVLVHRGGTPVAGRLVQASQQVLTVASLHRGRTTSTVVPVGAVAAVEITA